MEHDDDIPVGRILTRREALTLFGGAGLAFLAGCGGGSTGIATPTASPTSGASATATPIATTSATPTATSVSNLTCVVRPELTEGPYFVEEKLLRSDIRADTNSGTVQSGVILRLNFNVSRLSSSACSSLSGALVDVWHSNALGKYSDISSEGTLGQNFLRGYQVTDSGGNVNFTTIYPGWYSGRAVHIHFRVRATVAGTSYDFESQLFFNDTLTDTVLTASPYNTRGTRNTRNSNDNIYSQSNGQTLLSLSGSNSAGYTGTFNLALSVG